MTGHRRFFRDLQEGGTWIHVELGDGAQYQAQGVGIVSFQRESGKRLGFVDVLYVPRLTKNLISISTIEDKGFQVKFRDHRVYIMPKGSDRSLDQVIGIWSGKVYKLHFESAKALVSNNNSQGDLWHRRMTHLHHGALRHLRLTVIGVPQVQEEKHNHCKGCVLGKNIKNPFPQSEDKSKEPLNLVHLDVCRPMSVHSFSGYSYCITFIDDYSRKTWIYFMKAKSEVFERFQEFKTRGEPNMKENSGVEDRQWG